MRAVVCVCTITAHNYLCILIQVARIVIYCEFIKMSKRKREFKLTKKDICESLVGDNSENEEDLRLDKEDIGFLEEDILDAEENGFENANVVIEPASADTIENIVVNTEN